MKRKATSEFTKEEKEFMDTLAVNFIIAQADGFQSGYAQALKDFTENIIDYWDGSDDKPQESVLDALIDLGVELGKRKMIAKKNIETAKDRGYEDYYCWEYRYEDGPFTRNVTLFTKTEEEGGTEGDGNAQQDNDGQSVIPGAEKGR